MREKNRKTHRQAFAAVLAACAALLLALGLAGCSGTASTAGATLSESVDSDSAMATVTAIEDNVVSVTIGSQPGGDGGTPPEMSEGETGSSDASGDGGTPPEMPEGEGDSSGAGDGGTPPEKPEGEADASTGNADASNADGTASGDGGTPPEKPDGEAGSSDAGSGDATPPEKPEGEADAASGSSSDTDASDATSGDTASDGDNDGAAGNGDPGAGGDPGAMGGGTEATLTITDESIIYVSSGDTETQGSLEDIVVGSMLQLTVENGTSVVKIVVGSQSQQPDGSGPGSSAGSDSASGEVNNGSGATTLTADATEDGATYASSSADENALRVESGATATITNATVSKTGDSTSSEDSDFYGLNACVLVYDGSTLNLEGADISADSQGSNGLFVYGEGSTATVKDTTIATTAGNSGGIEVAGGGTLNAENLTVDTQGSNSAAIRSDRGGGTESVSGGSYTTHGKDSPALYCTADASVSDATLLAENSEGVVIEGLNSVALTDVDVTGNVSGGETHSGVVANVMIYQSMSGDAEEGTGSFSMKGGSFTATEGTLFYVTNTSATIELEDVEIDNSGDALLTVAGNDGTWGTSGSNGGSVTMTAIGQTLTGAISVDETSSLSLALSEGSSYEGAINGSGAAGTVDVTLDAESSWTLTGDCYVSSLSGETSGIDLNGHTLYVNGEAWSA